MHAMMLEKHKRMQHMAEAQVGGQPRPGLGGGRVGAGLRGTGAGSIRYRPA